MSSWSKVGDWIKDNAGNGASLVGSLLTGNIQGAIAAGMSIVSGATGTDNPDRALNELKNNPEALVKLKELYYKNEDSVRKHIETIRLAELEDAQKEHETTANVIVQGQKAAEKGFEKLSRPLMAWVSLLATIAFCFVSLNKGIPIDFVAVGILSSPCFAWMGLRTIDKRTQAKLK